MSRAFLHQASVPAASALHYGALHREWLDGRLDEFTPWSDSELSWTGLQRFAEFAIAYDVLVGSPLFDPGVATRWRSFIATHVGDPAYGEWARGSLQTAWAILLPYLILRRHGFVDPYHDATLSLSRRAGFPTILEVVPYRALDYAYFGTRAGLLDMDQREVQRLLDSTFAGRAHCRFLVDAEAAYGLTHAIFYATEFGQSSLSEDRLPAVNRIIDSMIIDSCIHRRFDLLAELLICSVVVSGTKPFIREIGMEVLYESLDASGSLLPDGSTAARSFPAAYHTTLVGLILCASLARPMH
ncbi:MAG TPA: hypothetical protein VMZ73_08775 [Acidimicrobiales bacterium]|nr:hypothetical protein [Acidimicrobiales bacterium]